MASRFLFHAYAVGVSGRFTRPVDQLIQSQAASALPPTGGYSSAREQPYQLFEIFSHGGATSEATGSRNPATQNNETSVTATVQDVNIENVVLLESCTA